MNWVNLFEKVLFGLPIDTPLCRPENSWTGDYAVWRLWRAKVDNPEAFLDHAVLARQCIRWIGSTRVRADRLSEPEREAFKAVGIMQRLSGYLEAGPYRPDWLGEGEPGNDLDALPQFATLDESFPAEEWLQRTSGMSSWRSHAQKEACWSALTAQLGDTILVGLPTGAGKSLVFQLAAAFSSGLTVVVVPTVALGIDQLANARKMPGVAPLSPYAYISGDEAESVRDAVANRVCRLLFTSPEALVSGRLRGVLDQLAGEGWLQWVVVDEAHIVESWGADFRIEFQLLGAIVRDWRRRSGNRIRTLLLSATFAASTQELLRELFTDNGSCWKGYVSQRLRPEIHYHIQRAATPRQQIEWVEEAIKHLPRPLILYVTEKTKATSWHEKLKRLGFKRVECFHGDTKEIERKRIMDAWRSDNIDIMVATSAFGMGVDKPDIRAVIHACFPESIDRFYQEVGRGGRDGASMQSVMVYTDEDKRVGKRLGPTLLRPETVNERWSAIWDSRRAVIGDTGAFQVRCDARRQAFVGVRTYQENVRWNKRLLQMLHRANLLTITGIHREKNEEASDEYVEWISVRDIRFPTIGALVGERVAPEREKELKVIVLGFNALVRCAQGKPVCCELQRHYGGYVARACGSCRACRLGEERRMTCGPLEWPQESPVTKPKVSVVPMARTNSQDGRDKWVMAIRRTLNQSAAVRYFVMEEDYSLASLLFRKAVGTEPVPKPYRLDLYDRDRPPVIDSRERTVAIHPTVFRTHLGDFNLNGEACSHWMPTDQVEDPHGRSRFTLEHAARSYDGFETWLFENLPNIF